MPEGPGDQEFPVPVIVMLLFPRYKERVMVAPLNNPHECVSVEASEAPSVCSVPEVKVRIFVAPIVTLSRK